MPIMHEGWVLRHGLTVLGHPGAAWPLHKVRCLRHRPSSSPQQGPCWCCTITHRHRYPLQMDTEGSEVHIMDLPAPIKADKAAEFVFTVRDPASCGPNCFAVRCGSVAAAHAAPALHRCLCLMCCACTQGSWMGGPRAADCCRHCCLALYGWG